MRALIIISLFLFSCNGNKRVTKIQRPFDCKQNNLEKLKSLSNYLVPSKEGVYDFDFERIKLPAGYDTLEWDTQIGIRSRLDSMATLYMIYSDSLWTISKTSCVNLMTTDEILEFYGKPTDIHPPNDYIYFFNTKSFPSCYEFKKEDLIQYANCSMITFFFDSENRLKSIGTYFFNP